MMVWVVMPGAADCKCVRAVALGCVVVHAVECSVEALFTRDLTHVCFAHIMMWVVVSGAAVGKCVCQG